MSKLIRDLWILDENGMVLYSRVLEKKVDDVLFGGMMAALNIFAEEISSKSITNLELHDIRFSFLKREHLVFIGNCERGEKEKKLLRELTVISDKFFECYGEQLDNWDNNSNKFLDFEDKFKADANNTLENFWKAF